MRCSSCGSWRGVNPESAAGCTLAILCLGPSDYQQRKVWKEAVEFSSRRLQRTVGLVIEPSNTRH